MAIRILITSMAACLLISTHTRRTHRWVSRGGCLVVRCALFDAETSGLDPSTIARLRADFASEVALLHALGAHRNVLAVFGTVAPAHQLAFVAEYCAHGSGMRCAAVGGEICALLEQSFVFRLTQNTAIFQGINLDISALNTFFLSPCFVCVSFSLSLSLSLSRSLRGALSSISRASAARRARAAA
jgi:hypothetical protein